MTEVCDADLVGWDPDQEVILMCRHLEENPITNSKHLKAAVKYLNALPQTRLIEDLLEIVDGIPDHKLETKDGGKLSITKALSIALSKALSNGYRKHPVTATASSTGAVSSGSDDVDIDEETGELYDKSTGEYIF